jgi:hypothetical protein
MSDSRSDRLAAGAGILAAVLFVAGFVLVGVDAAISDSTRHEVISTYTDDATNSRQALGVLLTGLGGVCFLPFLSYVRLALGRTAGDTSVLPGAAFAGGVLLVGGLVTGAVLSSAVSAGAYFDAYKVDADLAMTAVAAGFYLDGFAAMAGGVLIASVALVAYRTRLLPRWLTVLGLVVAVASVPAGLLGMWIMVEAVWIAIAAGLLARRAGAKQPGAIPVSGEAAAGARG